MRSAWRSSSAPASVGPSGAAAGAALEQAHPDDPLERADLLAQRGLRVAEARRGARERALLDDGVERREVAQLDAQQPISTIHGSRSEAVVGMAGISLLPSKTPHVPPPPPRLRPRHLRARVLRRARPVHARAAAARARARLRALARGDRRAALDGHARDARRRRARPGCRGALGRAAGLARRGRADRRVRRGAGDWPPDSRPFLAGRLLFGVGFAAIWTAGVTLLSGPGRAALGGREHGGGRRRRPPRRPAAVGPAQRRGLARAAVRGCSPRPPRSVTLVAAATRPAAGERVPAPGLGAVARAARRDPALRSATMLIAVVGTLTGLVPLLVPLLLDREGFSSGEIGAVFAVGSVIWILASALAVRAGRAGGHGRRRRHRARPARRRGADAGARAGHAVPDRLRRPARRDPGAALDDQLRPRRARRALGAGVGDRRGDGDAQPRVGRVRHRRAARSAACCSRAPARAGRSSAWRSPARPPGFWIRLHPRTRGGGHAMRAAAAGG